MLTRKRIKPRIKTWLLFIINSAILYLSSIACYAGDPEDPPEFPEEVPLDGGLLYLLIAGVAFGIKKLKDKKHTGIE